MGARLFLSLLLLLSPLSSAERTLTLDLVLSQHGESLGDVKAFVARARKALPSSVQLSRVFLLAHSARVPTKLPRDWSAHALGRGQEGDGLAATAWLEHHLHDAHASHFIYFSSAAPSKEVQATAFARLALLSEETGLLALGPVTRTSCSGLPLNAGLAPLLQALHFSATHQFCHGEAETETWPVYGSSFVVSHRRAAAQPHSLYRALRRQLELPGEHWIHANPAGSAGGDAASGSSAQRPMLGAAIELSWGLLFNCTVLRPGDACGAGAPQGCLCEEEACATCQAGNKGHWLGDAHEFLASVQ
jgi:hypothetical protein